MASNYWKASPAPREVTRLRHAVTEYASDRGVPGPVVADVGLAVSEVVGTCVLHDDPTDGEPITVTATVNGDEVTVRVVDESGGLRPRMEPPGSGMGLAIAGWVARRMVVERPARGGTDVRMTFCGAG